MTERPEYTESIREVGEVRKSLDSLPVPPPVPVESPMSMQLQPPPESPAAPPTDYDG